MEQVFAVVSRINYQPLVIEIFNYHKDALDAAITKAREGTKNFSDSALKEAYGDDATVLVAKARHLHFPSISYAATWGSTEDVVLVSCLGVQTPKQAAWDIFIANYQIMNYHNLRDNLCSVLSEAGGHAERVMEMIEKDHISALVFLKMLAPNNIRFIYTPPSEPTETVNG